MDINKERDIVEQAKKDPASFGILFDAYYPQIFGYILRRVGDPAVAQDVVAETFLKALKNINSFRWRGVSIRPWLYKIATNELRMYFRSNKHSAVSLDQLLEQDGYEAIDERDLVEEIIEAQTVIERAVDYQEAMKVLAALPIKYQEVISLRLVEKLKIAEIATVLGKKEGTVKSLLSRGLLKLRTALKVTEMQPFELASIVVSEGNTIPEENR